MSNQLIITIAGKKGGGKNTLGNFCVGYYLKTIKKIHDFRIEKDGTLSIQPLCHGLNQFNNIKNGEFNPEIFGKSVKLYSFADPLKQFCINTLGLTFEQCYGSDGEKNELTHCTRQVVVPTDGGHEVHNERLTARAVMQRFGTEFVRSLWMDAWAFATYKKIKDEGYALAIITDARFPNEVSMGIEHGAKTIKLERCISTTDLHPSETALDDYPDDKFDTVMHNADMTIEQQNEATAVLMERWLHE